MPDKDYIYHNVKIHYTALMDALRSKHPYSDKVVDSMSKGMLKNITEYGDKPVKLISDITKLLKPHYAKTPLERQGYDLKPLYDQLEQIVADSSAHKRAKAFIKEGAYRVINNLPMASPLKGNEVGQEICREYIFKMFEADCKERLPKSLKTDDSYSYDEVKQNLEEENKAQDILIDYYSDHLNKHQTVEKLRKKPKKRTEIDLDEDISI